MRLGVGWGPYTTYLYDRASSANAGGFIGFRRCWSTIPGYLCPLPCIHLRPACICWDECK